MTWRRSPPRWRTRPTTSTDGWAIRGRGAFGRFKAELAEEYPHLLLAWYAFRDARARRRAVERLAGNSLVDHDAVTRFLDEHPEPPCRDPDSRVRR